MTRPWLQSALIAGVSMSVALLSATVAFGSLSEKSQAISVLTSSALIYGVALAWLESGYVLLRNNSQHTNSAVFSLLALIRMCVFVIAALFGLWVTSFGLPVLSFAVIATGLSCSSAVISAARSGKMHAAAMLYVAGVLAAVAVSIALDVRNASTIVLIYAALTGGPVFLFAALSSGRGWMALLKDLFARTRSFVIDLPVTSVIENGDRVVLSAFGTPSTLIAYNGIKVAFGLQREFNRFLKQVTFHRLYDDATGVTAGRFTQRFMVIVVFSQCLALATGFIGYQWIQGHPPDALHVGIALCVSTAYTLAATHSIAGAHALKKATSAFWRANLIGLLAVLAALLALLPLTRDGGVLSIVVVVALSYLAFYAVKTAVLFWQLRLQP